MKNYLNKGLWFAFFFLSPLTLIGVLSQNSIPGDILYPVKLGIENVGLLVFSLTPESNASYNTSLSDNRFDEAQKLIVTHSDTTGLATLVAQTEKAQESISKVTDEKQKKVIEDKLLASINSYQEQLTQVQKNVDPSYVPPPSPSPTQSYIQNPSNKGQSNQQQGSIQRTAPIITRPVFNNIIPTKPLILPSPTPTSLPSSSGANPQQTNPTMPPQPTPTPTSQDVVNSIENTKTNLEIIKTIILQNSSQQTTEITPTAIPTLKITPTDTNNHERSNIQNKNSNIKNNDIPDNGSSNPN